MLNPIGYTEKVIRDFLRYQMTAYPFSDANLYAQMRSLLNLEETRATPLLKGPYISLSRTFRRGATVPELISATDLHPHLAQLIPYPAVYAPSVDVPRPKPSASQPPQRSLTPNAAPTPGEISPHDFSVCQKNRSCRSAKSTRRMCGIPIGRSPRPPPTIPPNT
jgi:predicted ATPase